ncbi:MFS transporter [Aromatoleum evansii]|jgi:MFS family permease|uniref:MFS transporter n=1 Tax=Aromatoleum evansii TaxID=59406 RepID=A0ABZ1AS85_AROEV|nr:MFS transporter [Aromatoleum toluclasticum]WRL48735.1 MFS transporter [Aromatoleum evansii]
MKDSEATAPERPWREVWLITIGHAFTHWYPATFYLLLPLIGRELGLTYGEVGLIMTCQYAAGAAANVPGGMLVDAVGRRGLLMAVSLAWVGLPYLLMGFVADYRLLLACVVLVGIGNNLWHPSAIPTLAERFPQRKGLVLSLHGMGGNAGEALAPLVVGSLLATFTWRDIVVMNVVPGLALAVAMVAMLGTLRGGRTTATPAGAAGRGQPPGEFRRGLRALLGNRSLVLLSASSAFRSMTQNALLTFLPLFLADRMGYSPMQTGVCLFVLQAAGFAAAPVAGHLSDRMGRRQVVTASMAATAAVLLSTAVAGSSAIFVAFVAVLGFFLYAVRPVMQAWLLEVTPKTVGGTTIGILFATQAAGSALGPMIGGLLADRYGLDAAFYFLAATIMCANLFVFGTPTQVVEPQPAAAPR